MLLPFMGKTYGVVYEMKVLTWNINFEQYGTPSIASQFTFVINLGLTYHYPNCYTLATCTISSKQIPMRIY